MNTKAYFSYFKLLSVIIIITGVCSCSLDDEDGVMPTALFIVSGTVVYANTDDMPMENVMVSLGMQFEQSNKDSIIIYLDSINIKAEHKGNFKLAIREFPQSQKFILNIRDVQTSSKERFQFKPQTIYFTNPSFENGNGAWYAGEVENKLGLIRIETYRNDNNPRKE